MTQESRTQHIKKLVGHTPLVRIRARMKGRSFEVLAKLETLNLTGSIKDRMALHIIDQATRSGRLDVGAPIYEASSGNTGISFAAIGRALGHSVRIYMPDWLSRERVMLIEGFGAEVVPISRAEGGFMGAIARAEEDIRKVGGFLPRQFENEDNIQAHYHGTGPELLRQVRALGMEPTRFVAGVGTGVTVMGAGRYLKEQVPGISVHPLEPANSPTMRTGERQGNHRIQGISDEFIPAIVKLDELSDIVDVWDGDAIIMAQRLARELGLGVGISSGANFLGAVQLATADGADTVVTTVFADSNKKYLSTDLWHREQVLDHYMSPHIELIDFETVSA